MRKHYHYAYFTEGKWRHGALSNLPEGTQLNSRVAGIQTQAGPQLGLHAC